MRKLGLLIQLICTSALLAQSAFTAKLEPIPGTPVANAFDISSMSAYWQNVVYKDDLYIAYWHGGGPSMTSNGTWTWSPPQCQPDPARPSLSNTSPECNDRVFMAWKHISCADPNWACASNSYWNVYSGSKNYHTSPSVSPNVNYFTWQSTGQSPPPVRRMMGWSDLQATTGFVKPACTGGGTEYSGAGTPAVIYVNGRWFMAFDANIWYGQGLDTHRIAWATSTDGANWTIRGIAIRDSSENSNCGAGILVNNLYFENNTFYMLVTSLGTNQMYLLKSPYSSSTTTGYSAGGWFAPTGKNVVSNQLIYPATPNIANGAVANFSSLQPLFDHNVGLSAPKYNPHGSIAKVYASSTSTQYRYVTVVDVSPAGTSAPACPPLNQSQPEIRVFLSDSLEKYMTVYDDIYRSDNTTGFNYRGYYSWSPNIPWLVPDAKYQKVYAPVTTFINYCAADNNRSNIARVRLKLCGDIFSQGCS